jgi:hypothetical protein
MPSLALLSWSTTRAAALNEIENAHQMVGGTGPGRRTATQQINQAYAMLLSSQFQGFCRDLHSECIGVLVRSVTPPILQPPVKAALTLNRKLDRGNPNPGNIGSDFDRFGFRVWFRVEAIDSRNSARKHQLETLNTWRNAIAHQDFDPTLLGGTITLGLASVRNWRSACHGLAESFDEVMRRHFHSILGTSPW